LRALDTGPGNGSPVAYGSPGAYDGLIDSRDAAFSELRIRRDLNSDGVSQEGELQTLAQAGMESIGGRPITTTIVIQAAGAIAGIPSEGSGWLRNMRLAMGLQPSGMPSARNWMR
jgi:hypothetical protein